jgi:autotransporter passenger strand-loop-strand repeat protein
MLSGGAIVSTGVVLYQPGSGVTVYGSPASSLTVDSGGIEYLLSGGTATSTTMSPGGAIDVTSLTYVTGGSASVNSSGLLTVSVGTGGYQQQLAGSFADLNFELARDTGSGTLIIAEAPCFCRGTLILTDRGEVPIDSLRLGDRVASAFGTVAPVIWLGHRDVDCRRHPKPRDLWPVRIAAGAFGPAGPRRDLWLSPDHAVFVEDSLIPVKCLINGSTIAQVPVPGVTYFHLELPRHEVLLAEGLPVESYLDTGNRSNFSNDGGAVRLHPDFAALNWEVLGCAPLIVTGPRLDAARARLAAIAASRFGRKTGWPSALPDVQSWHEPSFGTLRFVNRQRATVHHRLSLSRA